MRPLKPFHYRKGRLYCEDVSLAEVAESAETPCYVYSAAAVTGNLRLLRKAFAPLDPKICYAVKANSNQSILRLLRDAGSSFDVVSGGELFRLERLGVKPDRIIFSGVGKTPSELETAIARGIFALVVESPAELDRVADLSRGRPVRLALRINPDIDAGTHPYISTGLRGHKFGIDPDDLPAILETVRRHTHLELVGIGSHIGSQILDRDPFAEAFARIREMADNIRRRGFPLAFLDLGGGFGIPYSNEEPLDLDGLAGRLAPLSGDYRVVMEPGRFIVGSAGSLLARVLYSKVNHGKEFVIVDAGMNDLLRPALYGAHHDVLPLRESAATITGDLVGPVCESADFLARNRPLPKLATDDLVALMDVGAYGFVAASNYNSRPRPAEVLVEGEAFRIIRRREDYRDLIEGEE
jgi:diaminopimelate decarboxylase